MTPGPRWVVPATVSTVAAFSVLLGTAASAQTPPASPEELVRVTAVLPASDSRCVRSSVDTVSVESASAQTLRPARAWALTRGETVTVAVLDTGFDLSSPQLKGQVTLGPNTAVNAGSGNDCVGHGTFVAGLIAARTRTGTTVSGIAPRSHVYGITVTDRTGATSPDVIAEGIDVAVARGIRIIDVSVVSSRSSARLRRSVANAVRHGAIVIAPVAADDQDMAGPVYPAALEGVLAVGDSAGGGDSVVADITAPGQAVLSLGPGGGVCIGSGAAYAAALVAGSAALMDAYHPGLSRTQRLERLTGTAYPVGSSGSAPAVHGVVDPYAVVSAVLPREFGGATDSPSRQPIAPIPPAVRPPAMNRALALAGGGLALVVLSLCGVAVGRRGRSRH